MKPTKLLPAEHAVLVYYHTPEFGVSFEDILKPDYWSHVYKQLRPGHRIEVLSADGSYWGMLLVRFSGQNEVIVHELDHVEITGALEVTPASNEFEVKWRGPTKKWGVIRKADGEIVKDEFQTKEAANLWVSNRDKMLAA